MVNCKAKGTKNEHRSIAILEKSLYRCTRSAGSLGAWDIVGVGPTDFVLVQVKTGRMPGTIERAELEDFECPPNCKKLIHVWLPRQRMPLVKEV